MVAARRPLAAAILLAPSPSWGVVPSTLFEIAAAHGLMLRVGFWNTILEPSFAVTAMHSLDRFPKAEQEAIFARFVPESGRATFEVMHWGMDMRRASEVDTRKVTCPLLFLAGDADRINPPGTVERAAALYGGRASFETLPGMSHWLVGEPGWEQVCDRALAWLEEISRS